MERPPFKFSARTRVGFSDTDAQGIVYYGRYNPYFDLARVEYLRSLKLLHYRGGGDFVMRANDVEYFAPARFDDELEVFARVSRLGRTSVTFQFAAYTVDDGTLMVTAHQTLVYVDLRERKALLVPDDYKETIADILRQVVAVLHEQAGYPWSGIFFVEEGELTLGPQSGRPDESRRTSVPVTWQGVRVAELAVDDAPEEDRMFLERVALLVSGHCLVGWDTGGETWEP